MKGKRILFGICGSFCNHHAILIELEKLCVNNDVVCVVSENVYSCSTRFFENIEFLKRVETITKHDIIHTIVEAEKVGPNNDMDIMVIAPMTATVAAKLAHGIYDHPVTLAAKAMIRNKKNVVFGIASNDGLGISGPNIMRLLATKNIYAIPFRQDAPFKKERSIVAEWTLLESALDEAIVHKQIQPILLGGN
ncbi:dipicolinate synthase subunit B [Amedibacillus sp. YH-ame6]